MREVECDWCGATFVAQRSTARLCSNACRVAVHRWRKRMSASAEREDRYCECCYTVIDRGERIDKRFCSNACRQKNYRDSRPIDWGPPEMWAEIAALADRM